MRTILCCICVALLLVGACVGVWSQGTLTADQKSSIAADYYTASVIVATALTGKQLALLGDGGVLYLDELPESARQQIMDAATRVAGPDIVKQRLTDLPAGSRLGLWIAPEFSVWMEGGLFGNAGREEVPLRQIIPDFGTAEPKDYLPSPALPEVSNPPTLQAVLAAEPEDAAAKPAWAKSRAFDLLSPIGEVRLRRMEDVPFGYADFATGKSFAVNSLTAEQSKWVQVAYTRYRTLVQRRQALLKTYTPASGTAADAGTKPVTIAADGITANSASTPDYPLPGWSELTDARMTLRVAYLPTLSLFPKSSCDKGFGWSLR